MILVLGSSKTILLQLLRWTISIIVLTGILLMFYRFAPNTELPFKSILPGASIASIAWLLISFGFSFYIDNFGNYSADRKSTRLNSSHVSISSSVFCLNKIKLIM